MCVYVFTRLQGNNGVIASIVPLGNHNSCALNSAVGLGCRLAVEGLERSGRAAGLLEAAGRRNLRRARKAVTRAPGPWQLRWRYKTLKKKMREASHVGAEMQRAVMTAASALERLQALVRGHDPVVSVLLLLLLAAAAGALCVLGPRAGLQLFGLFWLRPPALRRRIPLSVPSNLAARLTPWYESPDGLCLRDGRVGLTPRPGTWKGK